jgi:S-(hydroxymethyl)glutathione dehydrogenase/alcohol dehydrogenase
VAIQCVGSAAVAEQAIELATFGGRVVLLGSSAEPFRARAVEICWRELALLGSRGFTVDDIRDVVDLYLGGKIVTDHLTARTRPLAEANDALEDLRAGRVLRTVLVP